MLPRRIYSKPSLAFCGFLIVHAVVWTVLPTLAYPNLRLDLIEALVYGQEWQLGYDKLPPLPWWIVEIVWRTFHADIALYAVAQLAVVSAFAFVWLLAKRLVGPVGALVSVLFLDGLHYFHEASTQFNHNVVGLPFWALTGLALHASLRDGRKRDWVLLGFALGMGLWSKYFVVVLAIPCALFLFVDRDARKSLMTPGPWITVIVGLIVAAPHLIWLVQHDFLPFAYADSQSDPRYGWYDHFLYPAKFAAIQFAFLIPSFAILWPLIGPRQSKPGNGREAAESNTTQFDAFDRRIVTWLTFGPVLTVIAMSLISGRGAQPMWGYPIWLFLGLWLVMEWRRVITDKMLTQIAAIWAAVFSVFVVAVVIDNSGLPVTGESYRASLFPGRELANEVARRFETATGKPLLYVVGAAWEGGNVSHYAPTHPRLLIEGDPQRAPWIDLDDLKKKGAVVVWSDSDLGQIPEPYKAFAGAAEVGEPIFLHLYRNGLKYGVGWALLRPR